MSVSDIMGHEGLTLLPELALLIFLIAFAVVAARLMRRSRTPGYEAAARLPLLDDDTTGSRRR